MPSKPRKRIEDRSLGGAPCAICGAAALQVTHLPDLPDYVTCGSCNSVFVMEDGGERVMYGRIPQEYPETRRFALKQWAWLEAVERKARQERSGAKAEIDLDIPTWARGMASTQQAVPEAPPSRVPPAQAERGTATADVSAREVSRVVEGPAPARAPVEPFVVPSPGPAAATPRPGPVGGPGQPTEEGSPEGNEPPPGYRYRIILKGSKFRLPRSVCVHCLRTPAPQILTVLAKLPRTQDPTRRGLGELRLPLCTPCQKRTEARGPQERRARMMSLLTSSFIAVLVVVVLAASGVLDFQQAFGMSLMVLLSFAIVGFGASAWFLLGRTGRFPSPPDALYVRSTLHIPDDVGPPEVAFDWRNKAYAAWFLSENRDLAVGEINQVPDRGQLSRVEPPQS